MCCTLYDDVESTVLCQENSPLQTRLIKSSFENTKQFT